MAEDAAAAGLSSAMPARRATHAKARHHVRDRLCSGRLGGVLLAAQRSRGLFCKLPEGRGNGMAQLKRERALVWPCADAEMKKEEEPVAAPAEAGSGPENADQVHPPASPPLHKCALPVSSTRGRGTRWGGCRARRTSAVAVAAV